MIIYSQKKLFGTLSLTMAKVGTISGHSVDTGHFLSVTNVEMDIDVRYGLSIWKYLENVLIQCLLFLLHTLNHLTKTKHYLQHI